jgi:hypothetical protein
MTHPADVAGDPDRTGMDAAVSASGSAGSARVVDTVVVFVLITGQLGLAAVAFISYIAIPMSTDNCAYVDCGSEQWITPAMAVVGLSPFVGMIFTAIAIYRLARRQTASWSPLAGCVAQFAMIVVAWVMAAQAGPIN